MSWRPRWRRPPGGVRGSATKVPTHQSNTGQQAQRSCVSAGRCAHRGANRWAIKKTFHTAKGGNRAGALPGQARISTTPVRSRPLSTHSDSPEGRLPQKVATISVSHGHAFPSDFSVTARRSSKQGTTVRTTPRGFIPRNVHHQALSNDHLHCSIERSLLK